MPTFNLRFIRPSLIVGLLLVNFFFVLPAQARINELRFQRYGLPEGLSQEAVFAITQDQQGFIWIATQEGLNRFDGYEFVTFFHEANNPNSLSNDAIYSMVAAQDGTLWLGTGNGGINRFDPKTESFERLSKQQGLSSDRINIIFEDNTETVWVGTDDRGLNRYDPETNSFETFVFSPQDNHSISNNTVRSIHQDNLGRLWVGTDKGLNLFNKKKQQFIRFNTNTEAPEAIKHGSINKIYEDSSNQIWIGTYEQGLISINADHSFSHFQYDENNSRSLCHNLVRDIMEDGQGNLWFATDNGLCQLPPDRKQFIRHHHNPNRLYSLSDNRTLSLFEDEGGVLWLGTYSGLNKWTNTDFALYQKSHKHAQALTSNIITAFAEDKQGNVWVGNYEGLNKFNPTTNQVLSLPDSTPLYRVLQNKRVMSLAVDSDNTLWVGTQASGLYGYSETSQQLKHYRYDENDPESISGNGITDILEDAQGQLWVSVYDGGLNLFNRDSETFKHYLHDNQTEHSLSNNLVLSIFQSRDGNLWLGTEGGGLNMFDPQTQKFSRFKHDPNDKSSLSSDVAWSVYEDKLGDLWVGTWGGGLNRWLLSDRKTGKAKFHRYFKSKNKHSGLQSSVIYDIIGDQYGAIWFSSNRGLTRYQVATDQYKQFDMTHGLQGNEFNLNAALGSRNGQLFFGGSNGFNAFYAKNVTLNAHAPKVVLTAVKKLNKKTGTVNVNWHGPKPVFNYQDYAVTFEFAALDYENSEKNTYKYRLLGLDQDWIDIGQTRTTTFTNLSAGDYVFQVKAANNDGTWSQPEINLQLAVTPPPWQTWWAYSLYAVSLFTLVIWIWRINVRKLREKAEYSRHLESQVKLRTQELTEVNRQLITAKEQAEAGNRSKGTFIATMSHELRTPMTSIIGFAESLLTDDVQQDENHRRVNKILRNAKHLLHLMNGILDMSKIEASQLDIERIPTSPVLLLQELEELIGQSAKQKGLAFDLNYQLPLPAEVMADPTRLKQILLNLCNNAIKFTESGTITVCMKAECNKLLFDVIDTGIGIPKEQQNKVFKAFSQADSSINRKYGGTGLGLSISKQLTALMGGEMTLSSEEGKGSCFSFTISLQTSDNQPWLNSTQALSAHLEQQNGVQIAIPRLSGHILLAEDWPDNQELIQMYIRRTGAEVTLVENGQQAVETALVKDFDLVLMDVQMPEVDGIEATQILRATGFSKPIVALTANISKEDIKHYCQSGFDDHLSKPIDSKIFYQKLSQLLPAPDDELNTMSQPVDLHKDDELNRLKAVFITKLPDLTSQVKILFKQEDWQSLKHLLHNLKGMGGSFGYANITNLADAACRALASDDINCLTGLSDKLIDALEHAHLAQPCSPIEKGVNYDT